MVSAALILVLYMKTAANLREDEGPSYAPTQITQPPGRYNGRFTATPTTASAADLVKAARTLKPLADLKKGDRVLYQDNWCYWRAWVGDINTSKVECGEGNVFDVETARLTPIEVKKKR